MHDVKQLFDVVKNHIGVGHVLVTERVSVLGKGRAHAYVLGSSEVPLGPVAHHDGFIGLDVQALENKSEGLRTWFALSGVVEGHNVIEEVVEVDKAEPQPRLACRRIRQNSQAEPLTVQLHQCCRYMRIGLQRCLARPAVGDDASGNDPRIDIAQHIFKELVEHLLVFDAQFGIDSIDAVLDLIEGEVEPGVHHGANGSIHSLALHGHEVYQCVVEIEDDGFYHVQRYRDTECRILDTALYRRFVPMNLTDVIQADIKEAMKSGDKLRLETLRSIRAGILEFEKSGLDRPMTDEDAISILTKAAKKRKDAIEQYLAAGRPDAAATEEAELAIIQGYLPAQMSRDEVAAVLADVIAAIGATGPSDVGKVMGAAMKQLKGKADGTLIQAVAKELLGAA